MVEEDHMRTDPIGRIRLKRLAGLLAVASLALGRVQRRDRVDRAIGRRPVRGTGDRRPVSGRRPERQRQRQDARDRLPLVRGRQQL